MLFDLNVPWPVNNYITRPSQQQLTNLKNTITTLYILGCTHIAVNFTLGEGARIPVNNPEQINPINIDELSNGLKHFRQLKLFTRITIVISDSSQGQGLSKLQNHFDIISIQPSTEKSLQMAATNLDIDLISLDLRSKLPYYLKFKTIGSALERGVKFEINYSNVIASPTGQTSSDSISNVGAHSRRNFFSNVVQLIRASRSRGLVISSGATRPLQARNSDDVLNLLQTLGLDKSRSKSFITINPEKVLLSGRLRLKSYKQTVTVGNDNRADVLMNNDKEKPDEKIDTNIHRKRALGSSSSSLLKKHKGIK